MKQSVTLRHAFIIVKGLKGREILRFAQYDIKTQGAIRVNGVPLPDFSNSNEL